MFEDKTYQQLKNVMLSNLNLDIAKNEGSFANEVLSASALNHAAFYTTLEDLLNIAFINKSFGENLDDRVKEFGIIRKEGIRAVGKIRILGEVGVEIGSGEIVVAYGKRYEVVDNQNGRITSESGVELYIMATEVGKEYNINTTTSFQLEDTKTEISSISNITPISGGVDRETDEDFKTRFFYTQSNKGTSGNIDDYVGWALEISGVKNVRVIPLWNGNGTVKVIIMSSHNRNVDNDILTSVREHIERKKPIGANVTVTTPTVLNINISATIEYKNTADKEFIENEVRRLGDEYLGGSIDEVTYTKIAGILSSIEGVADYKDLKVNNLTSNIKLQSEQVGSIGTISLTEGSVD